MTNDNKDFLRNMAFFAGLVLIGKFLVGPMTVIAAIVLIANWLDRARE